jgi:hypothetical protein
MISRLGNVLYWAACGLAILSGVGCVIAAMQSGTYNPSGWLIIGAVLAVGFWLVGRACRYVLAGR